MNTYQYLKTFKLLVPGDGMTQFSTDFFSKKDSSSVGVLDIGG